MWIKGGCIVAALLMAVVLFVNAKEIAKVNSVPSLVHKVEHFLYYGGMAALIAYGLGRRWFWLALLVVPLIGLLDEWHQLAIPGRNGSPIDWMVDVAGAAVAVYAYYRLTNRTERKTAGEG